MKKPIKQKQSGFIILMGVLLLVILASSWYGFYGSLKSTSMEMQQDDLGILQLQRIKQRMLNYAVLHPELFENGVNTPGVGYFPCPDENGDLISENICGADAGTDQLYVIGKVPLQIAGIGFNFIDSREANDLFWFAYDARMVVNSQQYATGTTSRFAELNPDLPNTVTDVGGGIVPPLTLDGQDDIVMVLFYAGQPLNNQNRPSNDINDYLEQPPIIHGNSIDFASAGNNPDLFNDYVIAITRNEWERAMLKRLTIDLDDNGSLDACNPAPNWMQDCTYFDTGANQPPFSCNADTVDNLNGQGWTTILNNCP